MTIAAYERRIDRTAGWQGPGRDRERTSSPVGAPVDFRERLARALETDDPQVLTAAAREFRGVYESEHAYIVARVAEDQPPHLAWVLACCDPCKLRAGYEGRFRAVWSIALGPGARMVFEAVRDREEQPRRDLEVEVDDEAPEAPCPCCGAHDWLVFNHADDSLLTPLGCDRCLRSTLH